ncbi:MAG: DNA polymerase Y family protein [Alphaproteobacteria bacterium]|nr:DNA polymerase Y family protein [Alphaproteobacteria bacterium]
MTSSPSTERDEAQPPLVLIATVKNAQQVTAVNDAAADAGLSPGMTLSHARALVPDVMTAPADPEGDRIALERLADWCVRYSPSTGLHDEPDDHGLWIDASGCAHLFGGEEAMLADLGQRLEHFGLRHRLGLADTPGAAWALARYSGDARSVDSLNVHDVLTGLPVTGLRLAPEILTLLRRLGLKTIGQLDALPRAALGKRFSSKEAHEAVLLRLDQLFGRVEEPLTPRRPPPVYRVEQAFLEPLIEPETLAHGLARLTSDLCRELDKKNQGAERLTFLAFRVDGEVKTLRVGASQATHDAGHIARLFAEKLGAIDPGFGIEKLALHAERTAPIEPRQKKLKGGADATTSLDERFAQLIDRLANRLGPNAVTISTPIESHLPERAEGRAVPGGRTAPGSTSKTWADMPQTAPRPSCLLLRPEPIKALAEVPDGPPLRFTWRRVTRRVVKSEGPERIAPEWVGTVGAVGAVGAADNVDLAAETRDYYRVEDEHGQRYWLFRQGLYDSPGNVDTHADHQVNAVGRSRPGWFIHGVFG